MSERNASTRRQSVPKLEAVIPGFSDALSAWLTTVSYDPQ